MTRYQPAPRGSYVTSPFGPRWGTVHWGTDFGRDGGSGGMAVVAAQAGTVVNSGAADGFGQWVVIDHPTAAGSGTTVYGHVIPKVKVGQRVEAGQLVAVVNPTKGPGNGDVDPHLHFEVHRTTWLPPSYDNRLDPVKWLAGAPYVDTPTTPVPPPKGTTTMKEVDYTGQSGNHSSRYGAAVRLFCLHTEEGSQSAEGLHRWMVNNGVSYHYVLDNRYAIDHVNTDRASWSVLDANSYTINLVFAGSKAGQSRGTWLANYGDAIDYAAKLFVDDAAKYGPLVPVVLGRDYKAISAGRNGGIDHSGVTYGLGIGDHTDVGPNFPWDVFTAAVERYAKGAPVIPVVNMINEEAKNSPWLGGRLTQGELSTPDGRGRYAQFEHGYIYWTPSTGARPVPNNIFETWAELGYEAGPLGYPVNYHTVLPVDGVDKVGDVQAFEGGTIYRKYGQPGHWVHGAIGNRWAREGFERSGWGWPVGNEVPVDGGGAYQDFDGGRIAWATDGTVGLKPKDGPDTIVPPVHS